MQGLSSPACSCLYGGTLDLTWVCPKCGNRYDGSAVETRMDELEMLLYAERKAMREMSDNVRVLGRKLALVQTFIKEWRVKAQSVRLIAFEWGDALNALERELSK